MPVLKSEYPDRASCDCRTLADVTRTNGNGLVVD